MWIEQLIDPRGKKHLICGFHINHKTVPQGGIERSGLPGLPMQEAPIN